MKKFNGYEETKAVAGGEKERLPKGAYVVIIKAVAELVYSWGNVLKFDLDIAEGDYKGFYQSQYDAQEQEDKKWKGNYRLTIPQDDGSDKDAWNKAKFKSAMLAFEESNPGYKWDWDETKLVGKTVGAVFNEKEWEMDGNSGYMSGWFTQCKFFTSVEKVRSGDIKMPKDEPLKNKKESEDGFSSISDTEEQFPF